MCAKVQTQWSQSRGFGAVRWGHRKCFPSIADSISAVGCSTRGEEWASRALTIKPVVQPLSLLITGYVVIICRRGMFLFVTKDQKSNERGKVPRLCA